MDLQTCMPEIIRILAGLLNVLVVVLVFKFTAEKLFRNYLKWKTRENRRMLRAQSAAVPSRDVPREPTPIQLEELPAPQAAPALASVAVVLEESAQPIATESAAREPSLPTSQPDPLPSPEPVPPKPAGVSEPAQVSYQSLLEPVAPVSQSPPAVAQPAGLTESEPKPKPANPILELSFFEEIASAPASIPFEPSKLPLPPVDNIAEPSPFAPSPVAAPFPAPLRSQDLLAQLNASIAQPLQPQKKVTLRTYSPLSTSPIPTTPGPAPIAVPVAVAVPTPPVAPKPAPFAFDDTPDIGEEEAGEPQTVVVKDAMVKELVNREQKFQEQKIQEQKSMDKKPASAPATGGREGVIPQPSAGLGASRDNANRYVYSRVGTPIPKKTEVPGDPSTKEKPRVSSGMSPHPANPTRESTTRPTAASSVAKENPIPHKTLREVAAPLRRTPANLAASANVLPQLPRPGEEEPTTRRKADERNIRETFAPDLKMREEETVEKELGDVLKDLEGQMENPPPDLSDFDPSADEEND